MPCHNSKNMQLSFRVAKKTDKLDIMKENRKLLTKNPHQLENVKEWSMNRQMATRVSE